jgi:hypothetical protein
MVTSASLKEQLEERLRTIEQLTASLSEEQAAQAPEGEWCVKEVLSHLAGEETETFYDGIRRFLDEDTPEYRITPGDSYFAGGRANASVAELARHVIEQYRRVGEIVGSLTEEQLARKAHLPAFKETPLGEYPALGVWVAGIINYHLPSHIEQLQALCK